MTSKTAKDIERIADALEEIAGLFICTADHDTDYSEKDKSAKALKIRLCDGFYGKVDTWSHYL